LTRFANSQQLLYVYFKNAEMRKCGNAEKGKSKSRSFTLLEIVFTIVIIGILLAIFLPAMSSIKLAAQKIKDQSNLRTIAGAWKEYPIERGILMDIEGEGADYGIWFAFSLGGSVKSQFNRSKSILNDPSVYISPGDKYASKAIDTHIVRAGEDKEVSWLMYNFGWSNAFSDDFDSGGFIFSYCTIASLDGSVPLATTPLAFTRGLKTDGTWDEKYGLYGSKGGYVVFCDGHVTWIDGGKPAKFLHWNGQEYTSDIRQAVPNVAKFGNGKISAPLTGKYSNLVMWGKGTGDD
jgi:prepilin-type processing-associated H-X9-DG protein